MQGCTEEPLGRLIYRTAQEIRNVAEKILEPHGLTVEQMHLLKNMPVGQGISQKELAASVGKAPANLTRMLDRLESKGLVLRQGDPDDRRIYRVVLTVRGEMLILSVHETFQAFSDSMLHGISDESQRAVRSCLGMMGRNIKKMDFNRIRATLATSHHAG